MEPGEKGNKMEKEEKEEKDAYHDHHTEISSLLNKDHSEISTTQPDSAYSSLGHSTYSSLGPISRPEPKSGSNSYSLSTSTSRSSNRQLSSKSSGSSGRSTQPGAQAGAGHSVQAQASAALTVVTGSSNVAASNKKENFDRPSRKKKPKIVHSGKDAASGTLFQPEEANAGSGNQSYGTVRECKAAKVATLSQALVLVDQFQKTQSSRVDKARRAPDQSDLNDLAINLLEASQGKVNRDGHDGARKYPMGAAENENIPEDAIVQHEKKQGEGLCVAVSLHDGMVMQTTASLTNILGYPKDMWVSRSFIDFVHPQDRDTFINQVTESISRTLRENEELESGKQELFSKNGTFFCRIRMYNGLKTGFSVKERKTRYNPFKLSVCFKEIEAKDAANPSPAEASGVAGTGATFLFITAIPLASAFKESFQDFSGKVNNSKPTFVTKHSGSCTFNNIDESSIPYLGYLPQDMCNDDIFNYIHPQDLPLIKEAFETAMLEQGKPVNGKTIRLKVRNGGYMVVNSWWSCFINPWSRLLEFVHGKHYVIKGPRHPDIFADYLREAEEAVEIPEENAKELAAIQNDIRSTLKRTVSRNSFVNTQSNNSTKTKKELSSFMGSLLEEVAKAETNKVGRDGRVGAVVIGNISPHQSDSSETPPSYNQLTYNENLTRFFNSQPKTLSDNEVRDLDKNPYLDDEFDDNKDDSNGSKDKKKRTKCTRSSRHGEDGGRSAQGSGGSGEQGQTTSGSGQDNGNNSSTLQTGLSAGQLQPGREECMMSQDGSGSGSRLGSGSRDTSNDTFKPPALTEELLALHNRDMERKMLTKFKEDKKTGELRFIKDTSKHKLAQANAMKRITLTKVDSSVLKSETLTRGLQQQIMTKNEVFPTSSGVVVPGRSSSHWAGMDQSSQSQAPFVPMRTKHVHDNHFGYTQTTIIQRNVQGAIPGFSGMALFPGLPHGHPRPPMGMKAPAVGHSPQSPNTQPELPNCLAVSSCMVCHANSSDKSSGKDPDFKLGKKNLVRPNSRTGSRATSVKGEPGSALESNASATASIKEKIVHTTSNPEGSFAKANKQGNESDPNCLSTSSSSLYSFLKTSEEYSITQGDSQNSSTDDGTDKKSGRRRKARPVLCDPFWLENVTLTQDLIMTYQMPTRSIEEVLENDRRRMKTMVQPDLVHCQLIELFETTTCDRYLGMAQDELEKSSESSFEESTSAEENEVDESVMRERLNKKRNYLDKLNIFLEADAPFPLPDSSKLGLSSTARESWTVMGSPRRDSSLGIGSESDTQAWCTTHTTSSNGSDKQSVSSVKPASGCAAGLPAAGPSSASSSAATDVPGDHRACHRQDGKEVSHGAADVEPSVASPVPGCSRDLTHAVEGAAQENGKGKRNKPEAGKEVGDDVDRRSTTANSTASSPIMRLLCSEQPGPSRLAYAAASPAASSPIMRLGGSEQPGPSRLSVTKDEKLADNNKSERKRKRCQDSSDSQNSGNEMSGKE